MSSKRFSKRQIRALAADPHPDDGIDPAEFFRTTRKRNPNHRKAQQLCHQVADTLSLVLGGYGDELEGLRVVEVVPAPDTSQLMVLVAPLVAGTEIHPAAVVARLATVAGRLRAEIASAITRKRAPKLLFQFVPEKAAEVRA